MRKRNKRKQLKVVGDYMMINGEKVKINPFETDLPDRCKLLLAELETGHKYELVERSDPEWTSSQPS